MKNHLSANLIPGNVQLFVDVGGGSTEITLYIDNEVIQKESFNIGTIRLLQDHSPDEEWQRMKLFLKTHAKNIEGLQVIGSGGNINKVFSISKMKDGKPLSVNFIKKFHAEIQPLSLEERMLRYNLREDRAAVIAPALHIYIHILKWSGRSEIFVPQIGLADGIIKKLYQDIQKPLCRIKTRAKIGKNRESSLFWAYEIPLPINSIEQYHQEYQRSIEDPEGFWSEIASHFTWKSNWNSVIGGNFSEGKSTWFEGAKLNITENCIDRHLTEKEIKMQSFLNLTIPMRKRNTLHTPICTNV